MSLPPVTTTTTMSASATASSASPERCGECGSRNSWITHTVRHRGALRVLCTHCVLRNHPTSFCPSCFVFYDSSPPHPSRRISCSKCFSLTHSHCAAADAKLPSYLCPPCRSPSSFSFFNLSVNSDGGDGDGVRFIDKRLADVLLCAARIASASMTKAVSAARCDADRRAREAALARKRAREALEHVVMLAGKEKARVSVPRLKEASVELSGSAAHRLPSPDFKPKSTTPAVKNVNGTAKETESPAIDSGHVSTTTTTSINNNNNNGHIENQSLRTANVKQEADASK